MTPCEELGYKVGDKFVYPEGQCEHYKFKQSDVLTLVRDDGTISPKFENQAGTWSFEDVSKLKKLETINYT